MNSGDRFFDWRCPPPELPAGGTETATVSSGRGTAGCSQIPYFNSFSFVLLRHDDQMKYLCKQP